MRAAVRPCAPSRWHLHLPPSLPGSCGRGFAVTPAFTLCPILPSRVTQPWELALGVSAPAQPLAEGEFLKHGAQPQFPIFALRIPVLTAHRAVRVLLP